MTDKKLTCIVCPIGCQIVVTQGDDHIESITGNQCNRGREYAIAEITHPVRTVTTTVAVENGELPVSPVKTDKPIPKQLIAECMRVINRCKVKAPVRIGDIVLSDVLHTGVNIVVTANIEASEPELISCRSGCLDACELGSGEINNDKKPPEW